VQEHLKLHRNDPEQSLAAVSSIRSVRDDLEKIVDADLQASLGLVAAAPCGLACFVPQTQPTFSPS
jgi:hypothetical protein